MAEGGTQQEETQLKQARMQPEQAETQLLLYIREYLEEVFAR